MTSDQPDPTMRHAVVYGAVIVALAFAAMAAGVAVHGTARTVLLALCPTITLVGMLVAVARTYRAWKSNGRWRLWYGVVWFLLMTTLVMFMTVGPAALGFRE
ncbi:hypothetical protein GOARA_067_00030 [Gordonia araii NBRC 100433]|uniref:Transmembrane protein n=1 Tax=Gordonia araii NBRC 100433 TaxID=1073574 RepID=G7H623_9ACTN|nr:hypothetical protein [Gordonia araii]NNG98739.1 hypothetical protein [Gordonia araii NBRC 100433]GAB11262.1 hypothetical protein GOARA_067_00030 [Gordonia araii NBRC 100433]